MPATAAHLRKVYGYQANNNGRRLPNAVDMVWSIQSCLQTHTYLPVTYTRQLLSQVLPGLLKPYLMVVYFQYQATSLNLILLQAQVHYNPCSMLLLLGGLCQLLPIMCLMTCLLNLNTHGAHPKKELLEVIIAIFNIISRTHKNS